MKNKEYKQNIPKALDDDALNTVNGGNSTKLPRTVMEV